MNRKRTQYYSTIRAIACVAIVLLHICNASEILFREQISLAQRIASLSATECMMWAVPCFVMVSGALLLEPGRDVTLRKIFSKYILRIFLALTICCVLFRGFDMVMNQEGFSLLFIPQGVWKMLTEGSWAHLWYLYLLIGLYLLLPFYRKIAANSTETELKYLLIVYVIFISLLQLTQLGGVRIAFYIHVSTIYPFYLFAGYAISHDLLHIRKGAAAAMIAAGAAGMVLCTWIRWTYEFEAIDCLLGYSSILVVLLACGVFSLFRECARGSESAGAAGTENRKTEGFITAWINHLDENSFGIYLLHMILVRYILRYRGFSPYTHGGVPMFALLVIGVTAVTHLVVWLLRRIPAVRRIL